MPRRPRVERHEQAVGDVSCLHACLQLLMALLASSALAILFSNVRASIGTTSGPLRPILIFAIIILSNRLDGQKACD